MDLSNIKPARGAVKNRKRIGRGEGSGRGGTSTRGHKGAQSRSGYSRHAGFEGGQMPLQRRVPKRGFKNPNRAEFKVFNLADLQRMADKWKVDTVNPGMLREYKMINKRHKIKVLGMGELKTKMTVEVHAVSASAKEAIEKVGGSVNLV